MNGLTNVSALVEWNGVQSPGWQSRQASGGQSRQSAEPLATTPLLKGRAAFHGPAIPDCLRLPPALHTEQMQQLQGDPNS